ncbi:MAG: NAD(P)/FAD-dependent oxidoreductase [Bacteriovoracaceae bacterium]|nr:NAD(P)/FAD-dependent oxidoreductase [Bacteriovoracaceae bacterium]
MSSKIYEITVIGGGAAGMMSVNRAILNNDEVLFFPGDAKTQKRSRARWVKKVDNVPGLLGLERAITDSNKVMLDWLQANTLSEKKLHLKSQESIKSIRKIMMGDKNIFELTSFKDETFLSEYVVLCTGMMDVQPVINETIRPILPFANKQLALYCLRCDGHLNVGKTLAVMGETNSAAWVAVMNYERYQLPKVILLTHGKTPKYSQEILELLAMYKIEVHESPVKEILGDAKEKILKSVVLESGQTIACESLFVSMGVMVYNELAVALGASIDERGFVVTNNTGETTIDHLYVAGDLRANAKKQIYTAWDQAVDCLDHINQRLRSERREKNLREYRKNLAGLSEIK